MKCSVYDSCYLHILLLLQPAFKQQRKKPAIGRWEDGISAAMGGEVVPDNKYVLPLGGACCGLDMCSPQVLTQKADLSPRELSHPKTTEL